MSDAKPMTRSRLLELMATHSLVPHRSLGQNFVVDPNTITRIVRLARIAPGDRVVEIGAGFGSLTLGLLDAGAEVTAVEIDDRLTPVSGDVTGGRARIVTGDALSIDWQAVLEDRTATLVANLPYNVATPVVLRLLDEVPLVERMLVMVQREVGERLAAGPGSRTYGIPSVKVAYWAEASVIATVPADVFVPKPRVTSVLVEIVRRPAAFAAVDTERLFTIVRSAFGQRRKTLRNSLSGFVDAEGFEAAHVDPSERPEQLDVDAWCRLASASAAVVGGSA